MANKYKSRWIDKNVPKNVLNLAVQVSKDAKAEYWACDIAYGKDRKIRI
jgi:hypothetical protein